METISVRSGNLSEFLAYIEQRGLIAKTEESSPEYLGEFGLGAINKGQQTIGAGDRIFYIALPTTIGGLPEYFLINIKNM